MNILSADAPTIPTDVNVGGVRFRRWPGDDIVVRDLSIEAAHIRNLDPDVTERQVAYRPRSPQYQARYDAWMAHESAGWFRQTWARLRKRIPVRPHPGRVIVDGCVMPEGGVEFSHAADSLVSNNVLGGRTVIKHVDHVLVVGNIYRPSALVR